MLSFTAKQRLIILVLLITMIVGGILFYVETTKGYSVELRAANSEEFLKVHVCGAVKNAGVIQIAVGSRVIDALESAGGTVETADLSRLNLAEYVLDGEQIYVPLRGEVRSAVASSSGSSAVKSSKKAKTDKLPQALPGANIDLNLATSEQLQTVPGIGPSMAERILAYRESNGGFKNYEELGEVKGIGKGYLEKFRGYLVVR